MLSKSLKIRWKDKVKSREPLSNVEWWSSYLFTCYRVEYFTFTNTWEVGKKNTQNNAETAFWLFGSKYSGNNVFHLFITRFYLRNSAFQNKVAINTCCYHHFNYWILVYLTKHCRHFDNSVGFCKAIGLLIRILPLKLVNFFLWVCTIFCCMLVGCSLVDVFLLLNVLWTATFICCRVSKLAPPSCFLLSRYELIAY